MTEQWRSFREGTYEVSSVGNIRRAVPGISTFVGRPVLPVVSATGYAQTDLRLNSKPRRLFVHRVVIETFCGPCPDGHVVNHLDGNKQNNALTNLEYVTYAGNARHALETIGRRRGPRKPRPPLKGIPRGSDHWTRRMPERVTRGTGFKSTKLTEDDVLAIRKRAGAGERQNVLAKAYSISVAQTSRIVRGMRWAHVGAK